MNNQFKKNIFGHVALLISWCVPVIFNLSTTKDASHDSTLTTSNYLGYLVLWILMLLPPLIMTWALSIQFSFRYSDIGILRMFPVKKMLITWHEINEVEMSIFSLSLKSNKKNVRINLLLYKNPKELVDFISNSLDKVREQ
jgi:hypothetical protein